MDKKKQRMSIYFPLNLLEQVRQSAEVNHRSFNQEVISILDRFLNRQKYTDRRHELQRQLFKEMHEKLSTPELEERLAKDVTYQAWLQACRDEPV